MRIDYYKAFASAGLLLMFFFEMGCKKTLDINHDPNFPSLDQGNPSLVFPVAVLATTSKTGGDLAIAGGMLSEYFTQASLGQQYTDIDSYNLTTTDGFVNGPWDVLFTSGLKNYQYVIDKARESGDWNFYLMATVMKVYTTTVLIDLYDQIPYAEALGGTTHLEPKFDDGHTLYKQLLDSLDKALGQDFTALTNSLPGKQDLIFNGNIKPIQF